MNNKRTLPWPEYPEKDVINEVLHSSKDFKTFYETERSKITQPVFWVKDDSLPEGINYRYSQLKTGEDVIRLRRVPAVSEDAIKIAHELTHIVIGTEGFPILSPVRPEYENLSSAIHSMVDDLLVNSRLREYGFDIESDYRKEMEKTKRQLANAPKPSGRYGKILWIVNYASHLLDWLLISGGKDRSEFEVWFDSKYPDIAARGKRLFKLVNKIGFDTPEKQYKLFKKIKLQYLLSGSVQIYRR